MNKLSKKVNSHIAFIFKKLEFYSTLPYIAFVVVGGTYLWMLHKPSWHSFEILCNIVIVFGGVLVASGSVVSPRMRNHLYDVVNGVNYSTLGNKEIAKLFVDASERSEAGTLTVIVASLGLLAKLIFQSG